MKPINPHDIAPPFAAYSHGVEIPAGQRMIRTSGQLGLKLDGSIPTNTYSQAMVCFENIDSILASAGMTKSDIFHLSAFVTDRSHMAGYMRARDEYLEQPESPPASTLLIVSGFTREEFTVEIEVSAASSD